MGTETVTLKLTASIAVGGAILNRGQLIEVTELEARGLLARGKAELATAADAPAPAPVAPPAPPAEVAAVIINGKEIVDTTKEVE